MVEFRLLETEPELEPEPFDGDPPFRDLVRFEWVDETSMWDPKATFHPGSDCYMRTFVSYIPERLMRRRPDLIDEFIHKYQEEDWIWRSTDE